MRLRRGYCLWPEARGGGSCCFRTTRRSSVAANVANNLPVALATGVALQGAHASGIVARAALVAVDLGPNLSVTGSLATLLWLFVLRRDGVEVTPLAFLKLGAFVTIPALVCAVLLVR